MDFTLSPNETQALLIWVIGFAIIILLGIAGGIVLKMLDNPYHHINEDCKKDKKPRYLRGPFK